MSFNAAIDVAISLILMYLVLSLIVTVVNEVIATAADLRASNLQAALIALIDDPALRTQFYNHGLIAGVNDATADGKGILFRIIDRLYRVLTRSGAADGPHVSYLSAQVFARALLGSVDVAKNLPTYQDIENAVKALPDTNIRDALLAQLATANGDLQLLHQNVAAWFDNTMDRVSGLYKRHLKQISLFVGTVLVLVVNADTLKVTKSMWNDAALRATIVQTASVLVAERQGNSASNTAAAAAGNSGGQAAATPQPDFDVSVRAAVQRIRSAEQRLRPLPLGWSVSTAPQWRWSLVWPVLAKVVGLALTAIAISLGAPFWFDLLSMFMRIRGTGDKPEKTSAT